MFKGYNEKQLLEIIDFWEQKMSAKQLMTRGEAIEYMRAISGNILQAEQIVNFFIKAGMLEVKEEKKNPIFEIKGEFVHIKIWADGRMEGIKGIVINRIPEHLMKNNH